MSFWKKINKTVSGGLTSLSSLTSKVADKASSAIEAAKHSTDLDVMRHKLEEEEAKAVVTDAQLSKMNFTYIDSRIIAMGFPCSEKTRIQSKNKAAIVAKALKQRHGIHYMVWNLSECSYDGDVFDNQVMEYKFPGSPAPPLEVLFKIVTSIENWLTADEKNVAAIHCMTGKGRTVVVIACLMTWLGMRSTPLEALNDVCELRGSDMEKMTIPSQRRYTQYFSLILEGVRPRPKPMVLKRVILNSVPAMIDVAEDDPRKHPIICKPILQIFVGARMIFSSVSRGEEVPGYSATDESIRFAVDVPVQGDILLRCQHDEGKDKPNTTMLRAAFHTGYVAEHMLRLTKSQLDMACKNPRIKREFFVELIFAPADEGAGESKADGKASGTSGLLSSKGDFWVEIERRKRERSTRRRRPKPRMVKAPSASDGPAFGFSDDEEDAEPRPAPTPAGGGSSAEGPDAETSALLSEMRELEALERELGIGNLSASLRDKALEVSETTAEAPVSDAGGSGAGSGETGAADASAGGEPAVRSEEVDKTSEKEPISGESEEPRASASVPGDCPADPPVPPVVPVAAPAPASAADADGGSHSGADASMATDSDPPAAAAAASPDASTKPKEAPVAVETGATSEPDTGPEPAPSAEASEPAASDPLLDDLESFLDGLE